MAETKVKVNTIPVEFDARVVWSGEKTSKDKQTEWHVYIVKFDTGYKTKEGKAVEFSLVCKKFGLKRKDELIAKDKHVHISGELQASSYKPEGAKEYTNETFVKINTIEEILF